ncbi:hypothetical protein RIF29_13157 [Crotalaria pallida]|uniref:Uncharacterized protein n=1 Tax=Crotalaria pallida TaxID=3830 RepID=A0AAN9P2S9_CROPI
MGSSQPPPKFSLSPFSDFLSQVSNFLLDPQSIPQFLTGFDPIPIGVFGVLLSNFHILEDGSVKLERKS